MDTFYFLHTFSVANNLRERGLFLGGGGGGGRGKFFPRKNKFSFERLRFAGIYTVIKFHSYDELSSSLFSTVKHQARDDFGFVCAMDDG